MNVCITPAAHIAEGKIIGMGATVAGVMSPFSNVTMGKFYRVIFIEKEHYKRLNIEIIQG